MNNAAEKRHIRALSRLTLDPANSAPSVEYVAGLDQQGRAELLSLAALNHVVLRALRPVLLAAERTNPDLAEWASNAIKAERARIENALRILDSVCHEFETAGLPITVMKSLDHWPDLGNDLDLYVSAESGPVIALFVEKFHAEIEGRTWGDRFAGKWSFLVPGLSKAIEVHCERLGQMGEHTALARRFVARRVWTQIDGYTFPMPAPEERVIAATLQRVYRHFYVRVCDVANTAALIDAQAIDFAELRRAAELGGIWPGIASYLRTVSEYVKSYRGRGLELPEEVLSSARFGAEKVDVRNHFLRLPIVPQGADLYVRQMFRTAMQGNVSAIGRLSLLLPLASAAGLFYVFTGNRKGVW